MFGISFKLKPMVVHIADNNSNKNEECGYSCIYKSQTSSMIYHIQNVHKEYERKSEVSTDWFNHMIKLLFYLYILILIIILAIKS